jgi:hypothetical protein
MINKDILRQAIANGAFGPTDPFGLPNVLDAVAAMTDDEINVVLSAYIENKKTELGNQITMAQERLAALQQQLAAVTEVS